MVIIDVKMLSGFVPVKPSLDKVNYRSKIKQVTPGTKEKTGHDENGGPVKHHSPTNPARCLRGCTVLITGWREWPAGSCKRTDLPTSKTRKGSS